MPSPSRDGGPAVGACVCSNCGEETLVSEFVSHMQYCPSVPKTAYCSTRWVYPPGCREDSVRPPPRPPVRRRRNKKAPQKPSPAACPEDADPETVDEVERPGGVNRDAEGNAFAVSSILNSGAGLNGWEAKVFDSPQQLPRLRVAISDLGHEQRLRVGCYVIVQYTADWPQQPPEIGLRRKSSRLPPQGFEEFARRAAAAAAAMVDDCGPDFDVLSLIQQLGEEYEEVVQQSRMTQHDAAAASATAAAAASPSRPPPPQQQQQQQQPAPAAFPCGSPSPAARPLYAAPEAGPLRNTSVSPPAAGEARPSLGGCPFWAPTPLGGPDGGVAPYDWAAAADSSHSDSSSPRRGSARAAPPALPPQSPSTPTVPVQPQQPQQPAQAQRGQPPGCSGCATQPQRRGCNGSGTTNSATPSSSGDGDSSSSSSSSSDVPLRERVWGQRRARARTPTPPAESSDEEEGEEEEERQAEGDDAGLRALLRTHFAADPAKLLRAESALEQAGLLVPPRGSGSQAVVPAPPAPPGPAANRFGSCFKEVKQIGRGGQGRVWQVQNVLDGNYYAVKRIPLRARIGQREEPRYNRVIFKEVQTLAKLKYHPYIVRYYTAWDEATTLVHADTCGDLEGLDTTIGDSASANHFFTFARSDAGNSTSGSESSAPSEEDPEERPRLPSGNQPRRFLYIQMEYCTQDTLRQAIDRRIFTDKHHRGAACGVRILRQLLECVAYIHRNGVIHRDLKPENIFFDFRDSAGDVYSDYYGDIKVGDFGLATDFAGSEEMLHSEGIAAIAAAAAQLAPESERRYSQGIGTPLYSAPEQMSRRDYNEKVDEYSLGIIAFEMFSSFGTQGERIATIVQLRDSSKVPESWRKLVTERGLPGLPRMVEALTSRKPDERPEAAEVLDGQYLPLVAEGSELHQALRTFDRHREAVVQRQFERTAADLNALNASEIALLAAQGNEWHLSEARHGSWVREMATEVFRRFGAIEVFVPVTVPLNSVVHSAQPESSLSMGPQGTLNAALPNPSVAFARWLATPRRAETPVPLRRYSVANMSQIRLTESGKLAETRDARRLKETACFDLVTLSDPAGPAAGMQRAAADTEVLLAACSVMSRCPLPAGRRWVIRLSHTALLYGLFAACQLPDHLRDEFRRQLNAAAWELRQRKQAAGRTGGELAPPPSLKASWDKLGQRSPSGTLAAISRLLQPRPFATGAAGGGAAAALREEITAGKSPFCGAVAEEVRAALVVVDLVEEQLQNASPFREMRDAGLLRAELDVSHAKHWRAYRGVFYSIDLAWHNETEHSPAGIGGRYDAVLHDLRRHYQGAAARRGAQGQQLRSVPEWLTAAGVCFSLPTLAVQCGLAARGAAQSASPDGSTRIGCGPLVHIGVAPSTRHDPFALLACAAALREQGVSADWQTESAVAVNTLQSRCSQVGTPWLLILPRDSGASAKLKRVRLHSEPEQEQAHRAAEVQIDAGRGYGALARRVAGVLSRVAKHHQQPDPTAETQSVARLDVTAAGPVRSAYQPRQIVQLARDWFAPYPVPAEVILSCDLTVADARAAVAALAGGSPPPEGGGHRASGGPAAGAQLAELVRRTLADHPTVLIWADADKAFDVVLREALTVSSSPRRRRPRTGDLKRDSRKSQSHR
eukprot:TRINITY_DN10571_c0_g1_i1.p1 TRINITY_DN10571_c0_g1~~TRINITY_DN10571_c0_g1_i1.p1  ORF type:complete len:1637 (+),score=506.99 TRINITY_DN10571_c0_g1_i1:101-5011(+)